MLAPTVLWQKVATLFFTIHYFYLLKITAGASPALQLRDIFLHHTYYFLPIFPALRMGTWRTKGCIFRQSKTS